ncbi:hypothetical protein LR48_Vigan10g028500 [Vigna angularis]|uniref:Uncharacterized protein n=1 Tax=Phaseolus angularis TaxID=3914 RepID=A0A0L9VHB8_PHAAN|nr:hypothetical protein LR48_Vigan10g028500 [Vigna angularis]
MRQFEQQFESHGMHPHPSPVQELVVPPTGRSGKGSCSAPAVPRDDMDDASPCLLYILDGTRTMLVAREITHEQEQIRLFEDDSFGALQQLCDIIANEPTKVEYDANVFGRGFEVPIYLHSQYVRELSSRREEYMFGVSNNLGYNDVYGFIDPQVTHDANNFDDITTYLTSSFARGKDIYFIPYISSYKRIVEFATQVFEIDIGDLPEPSNIVTGSEILVEVIGMIWKRNKSFKELELRKDKKSTKREGYKRSQDAKLPFSGALGAEKVFSVTSLPDQAAKLVKRNHDYFSPRVKEDDGDKEEKLVHQDSMLKNNESYLGKAVKFKNKLWVIKAIKANGDLEIEGPYSRRVKLMARKMLRLCWCHERKKNANIKNSN